MFDFVPPDTLELPVEVDDPDEETAPPEEEDAVEAFAATYVAWLMLLRSESQRWNIPSPTVTLSVADFPVAIVAVLCGASPFPMIERACVSFPRFVTTSVTFPAGNDVGFTIRPLSFSVTETCVGVALAQRSATPPSPSARTAATSTRWATRVGVGLPESGARERISVSVPG